jgi:hypothetical protein
MIDDKLFSACSLYGLCKLLKVLEVKPKDPKVATALNATQLTRHAGIRSYQQIQKYLRLAMGLRLILAYGAPSKHTPDSVFVKVYEITDEGRAFLKALEGFDDSKAIYRETIWRFPIEKTAKR